MALVGNRRASGETLVNASDPCDRHELELQAIKPTPALPVIAGGLYGFQAWGTEVTSHQCLDLP